MTPLPPSPQPPSASRQPRRSSVGVLAVAAMAVFALIVGVATGVWIASDGDGDDRVLSLASLTTTTTSTSSTTTTIPEPVQLAYTAEELVEEFGDAVWRVETEGCGEVWSGTAFAIDDQHLVTNHHVVANSTRPSLRHRDGSTISGTVIGWSERPDIAVVRVDDGVDRWLEWAPTDELREGQNLLALGYPVPDTVFTATPGSIMSFQSRTGEREALRTNAALDRGNSGGPVLDVQGRVVGVVTEMAPNLGGFQLVPLIFTHDAVDELIDEFLESPEEPEVNCANAPDDSLDPDTSDPETWSSGAEVYGDHPVLDELWDACAEGDLYSCDDLWWMAPAGSEYESFGDTCGNRNKPGEWCSEDFVP